MEGSLVAYKVFTNGSVLNASEINDNLMNQSVMVFSNSTARSAALTSPLAGMVTFLEDTSSYESYDGTSWIGFGGGSAILQVVSTTMTAPFTVSVPTGGSGTSTEVTGLTATITPSSTTSKILVDVNTNMNVTGDQGISFLIRRNGTILSGAVGDASSGRQSVTTGVRFGSGYSIGAASLAYLDSPETTSAITYSIVLGSSNTATQTAYVNRSVTDAAVGPSPRGISTIILMEVAG
jgi:hypothetical protein